MTDLTKEQCEEYRRLPVPFNEMVRAIYRAGYDEGYAAGVPLPMDALKDWHKKENGNVE